MNVESGANLIAGKAFGCQSPSFAHAVWSQLGHPLPLSAIACAVDGAFRLVLFSCCPSQMRRIDAAPVSARMRNLHSHARLRAMRPHAHQPVRSRGSSFVVDATVAIRAKRKRPFNADMFPSRKRSTKKCGGSASRRRHGLRIHRAASLNAHVVHEAKILASRWFFAILNSTFHLLSLTIRRDSGNAVNSIAAFDTARVLGYRWPPGAPYTSAPLARYVGNHTLSNNEA